MPQDFLDASDPFADLLPSSDNAAAGDPFADLVPNSSNTFEITRPEPHQGVADTPTNYLSEFSKAIGQGAADLGGTVLKGAAAAQTAASRGMVGFVDRQLRVMERIDRGEPVDPSEDQYGYGKMPAPERLATRRRLTARLTEFNLPGGPTQRDAYKAGEFVSAAGRKAFPASPGWEDSTTVALGKGVGSVVAGLPVMLAGPAAGALVFGAAGSGEALDRAVQQGASDDDQMKAALLGFGPGTTDVAPLEFLLSSNRITARFKKPLARVIARIGGQAFIEGAQEGGQQWVQNLIAREIYKPDQSLSEGIVPNTELGAGVGGIAAVGHELVNLLVGRRGGHVRAQPPPIPEGRAFDLESGSATEDSIADSERVAGGVSSGGLPGTGQTPAGRPGFPGAGETPSPTDIFADLVPAADDPFADLVPQSAIPDLALTGKGQRLAYGGSGEASRKTFRRVDKSGLEVGADRLTRDVRAFEDELVASGLSSEQVAANISRTFGFDVAPEDVASGQAWWRLPERGGAIAPSESAPTPATRFEPLSEPQRAEVLGLSETGLSPAQIAHRLALNPIAVGAVVQAAKARAIVPARDPQSLTPTQELYTTADLDGLNARDAAAKLSAKLGREVTPRAVYRARQRAAVKGMQLPSMRGRSESVWTDDAIAALKAADQASLTDQVIADQLNSQFPSFEGRLTPNAIRQRRTKSTRGLSAGGRTLGKDDPMLAITTDEAAEQKALLAQQWGAAVTGRLKESAPDTGLRPVPPSASREAASARPIDWQHQSIRNMLEGRRREPSSRGDFAWPPDALGMIREAEGRQTFEQLAGALSARFDFPVTRNMVAGKVKRLRDLSRTPRARGEPMLAIGNPEGWFARFRRSGDVRRGDLPAPRADVAQQGRAITGGRPGAAAVADAGAQRAELRGDRGRVSRIDAGRYRGLVIETANVNGLRQRRYFLYPQSSQLPSESASPLVALRVARSSSSWVAKAHVTEIAPGDWHVLGINVRRNRQRRGIGGELYDLIGAELGVDLGPSPRLSRQLYRFWEKRDPQTVRNYQRIGDNYYAPEMVRELRAITEEILKGATSPRDRAQALKFRAEIDAALANLVTPELAVRDDQTARQHVAAFLKMGKAVAVPPRVVQEVNTVLAEHMHIFPKGIRAGTISKVEPIKGEAGYLGADTLATFTAPDGTTFNMELRWSLLATSRALYDHFTGSFVLTRFGTFNPAEQFHNTLTGEVRHETVHLLRRGGLLSGAAWQRLVGHAQSLRILNMLQRDYLKMVGDPIADKIPDWVPGLRLRDAYERAYRHTSDLSERLDQEAVAHMAELYSHGKLTADQVAPVRDLLDSLQAGKIPPAVRARAPLSAPLAALGASIPPTGPPPLPGLGAPRPVPQHQVRALERWKTSVLEYWQDSEVRIRKLGERVGQGRLPDAADPYLKATLFHGRLQSKVRQGYDEAENILRDAQRLAKKTSTPFESVRATVNDYLIAKHAPERNAQHGNGAAGMTNAEAQSVLHTINSLPEAREIRALGDRARALNERTLDMLHDAGVISTQTLTRLRSVYRFHVPLNRVMAEQPDFVGAMAGKGFDVFSSGIRKARGSDLEVSDILGNILLNYEQAAIRSEKNLVDLSTLAFVRRHKADLNGLMRVRPPRILGSRPDGSPIFEQTQDPRILHMFEDGKPVWIEISDPHLAVAFRSVGRQQLPQFLRWVGTFTRLYSGLQTRFNPEFAAPNKLRDLQEAMVYLAADKNLRAKGALKAVARDPASLKAVLDHLAGRNTPGAQRYAEMIAAGGTTGGMGLSTREQVELNIEKLEKLATSKPRQFAQGLVSLVDGWNTLFEDSTRLSVYNTARERGLSVERAAFLAKEATINFNRMGTAGPIVNALWMFSNASIQGSVKMMRSLRNPKVALATGIVVAVVVAAVTEWNDEIDPDWRDKVSKWDRLNSLPLVLPGEDGTGAVRYVSIPVSWGLKPLYVMASHAYDTAKGVGASLSKMLSDFTVSILEAYNPVGGTDLTQAIAPTPLDAIIDLARNRSWSGSRIKPDFDADVPADKQYFMSLKDTAAGRVAIGTTQALREVVGIEVSPADLAYATQQAVGGAGRFVGKTANALVGAATGNQPPLDDMPFISRFYRQRDAEEIGKGQISTDVMKDLADRREAQARERFSVRDRADDAKRRITALPESERPAAFQDLKRSDPEAARAFAQGFEKNALELTAEERGLLKLGVENGSRAGYIADRVRSMSEIQRQALFKAWRHKDILTPDVMAQVRRLLSGRQLPPRRQGPIITPKPLRQQPGTQFTVPTAPSSGVDPFADLIPQ